MIYSNEKTILQPGISEHNNNVTGSLSGNGRTFTTERTGTLDFGGETTGSNQQGNGQTENNAGNANRQGRTTEPDDADGRDLRIDDGNKGNDDGSIKGNDGANDRGIRGKDVNELPRRPDELGGDKIIFPKAQSHFNPMSKKNELPHNQK